MGFLARTQARVLVVAFLLVASAVAVGAASDPLLVRDVNPGPDSSVLRAFVGGFAPDMDRTTELYMDDRPGPT